MSRVRYSKTSDPEILMSKRVLFHRTNGAQYIVKLNLRDLKWQVLDYASRMVVLEGTAVSEHKMKIRVRDALDSLGIVVPVEKRKTTGVSK